MDIITIPMQIPKAMASYVEGNDQKRTFERNAMMLYPYIQDMTISHGRAAEILGVRKTELIEFYDSMGIPYLNQSKSELLDELAAFERIREKRA